MVQMVEDVQVGVVVAWEPIPTRPCIAGSGTSYMSYLETVIPGSGFSFYRPLAPA